MRKQSSAKGIAPKKSPRTKAPQAEPRMIDPEAIRLAVDLLSASVEIAAALLKVPTK